MFTKEGFVPVKLTASGLTSTTANVNAKLEIAGSTNVILIFLNKSPKEQCLVSFLQRHPIVEERFVSSDLHSRISKNC